MRTTQPKAPLRVVILIVATLVYTALRLESLICNLQLQHTLEEGCVSSNAFLAATTRPLFDNKTATAASPPPSLS
jgi:hypothetical protein